MKRYDRIKAVVSLDAIAYNFQEMKKISEKIQKSLQLSRLTDMDMGQRLWRRLSRIMIIFGDLPWLLPKRLCSFVPLV